MRRNIGKRIKTSLRQLKEDMQELQRLMTHKSVYAKATFTKYSRRPKHPVRYEIKEKAPDIHYIQY
jgi:gas vesicle protein